MRQVAVLVVEFGQQNLDWLDYQDKVGEAPAVMGHRQS